MFLHIKSSAQYALLQKVLQTVQMMYSINIRMYASKSGSITVNPLDTFTNHLVKEKSKLFIRSARKQNIPLDPLKIHGLSIEELPVDKKIHLDIDINNLSIVHVDNLILSALDEKNTYDVTFILNHCNNCKRLPSTSTILEVASYYSKLGLIDELTELKNILVELNSQDYELNAELKHFFAEVSWKQGNLENAINSFLFLYKKHEFLRLKILEMSLHMITELVSKGSDANLVMLTNFAKTLVSEHKEFQPLSLIWELTFLSEWFSDQVWANELLEKTPELIDRIKHRFYPIAVQSLEKNQVNIVQRILEILLAYKLKLQYIQLLHLLFDYKCCQQDLRGCTEIMNVAIAQDIPMRGSHQMKFLQLLLGKNVHRNKKPVTKIPVPKYILKF